MVWDSRLVNFVQVFSNFVFELILGRSGLGLLVVGFVALRPKSTAMVIAGRSVHLTTRFPGQA